MHMKEITITIQSDNIVTALIREDETGTLIATFEERNLNSSVREALDWVAERVSFACSTCLTHMNRDWRYENTSGLCPTCWSQKMANR